MIDAAHKTTAARHPLTSSIILASSLVWPIPAGIDMPGRFIAIDLRLLRAHAEIRLC